MPVVAGAVLAGGEARPVPARSCALLGREGAILIATAEQPGRALVLTGRPFGEPIAHHGPFVMNTHAELLTAVDDYQNGRF